MPDSWLNQRPNFTWGNLVIWTCWLGGTGLILAACLDVLDIAWGILGLAAIALGHLRAVAAMMLEQRQREARAYEYGRESVRSIYRP